MVRNHVRQHTSSSSFSPTFAFPTAMAEQYSGTAARNMRNTELQALRQQAFGAQIGIPVYPDEAFAQFDKAEFFRKYPLSQAQDGVSVKAQSIRSGAAAEVAELRVDMTPRPIPEGF